MSALGAIALCTSDSDLLDAVSSELGNADPHQRYMDRSDLAGLVLSTHSIVEGQPEEAVADLSKSLSADPWNPTIRARLAKVYLALDQAENARDVLYMDMRDTEDELVSLRGVSRVRSGEKGGEKEVMRAVRARPWEEGRWRELEWAVRAAKDLPEVENQVENGDVQEQVEADVEDA